MQTKKQAIKDFREFLLPSIPNSDTIAKREAWNNYTDALVRAVSLAFANMKTGPTPSELIP